MKIIKFLLSPFVSPIFYLGIITGLILILVLPVDRWFSSLSGKWEVLAWYTFGAYLGELVWPLISPQHRFGPYWKNKNDEDDPGAV